MSWAAHIERLDRAVLAHLGKVSVLYESQAAAPVTVDGLFDEPYQLVDRGHGAVEAVTPTVWLQLADLPVHPDEDEPQLTIGGKLYRVRERKPDGGGTIALLLHLVDPEVDG